jgi:hypothetical protein
MFPMLLVVLMLVVEKYVVIVVVVLEVWDVVKTKIADPWSTTQHRPPNHQGTNIIATFVIYAAEMRKTTMMIMGQQSNSSKKLLLLYCHIGMVMMFQTKAIDYYCLDATNRGIISTTSSILLAVSSSLRPPGAASLLPIQSTSLSGRWRAQRIQNSPSKR